MCLHDWTIYQFVDSKGPGGIETHILNLSRWLNAEGFRCEVIFLKNHGLHPLKDALRSEGLPYRSLNSLFDLKSLLKSTPGLLCTHGYKAGILGRIVSWCLRTPCVSTYHSGDMGAGKLKLYSMIDDLSAFLADELLSVSSEIIERLPCESEPLVNFVPAKKLLAERGKTVAFVGRLSSEKDPHSFARITQNLSFSCHIYGDGPEMSGLKRRYDHLVYWGYVDMRDHWENIGVLCITSKYEGLPLVALEAMGRGIPVISYAVGGLPELIKEGENGWLVPAGDETEFKRIVDLWVAKTATEKAAMAITAHHHVLKNYSDEAVCPKIVALYERAIGRYERNSVRSESA